MTLIVVALVLFQVSKSLSQSSDDLSQSKKESRKSAIKYKSIETKLEKNRGSIDSINAFSKGWETFLNKSMEPTKVLNDIVGLSFKNTVAVSEKSAQRSHRGSSERIPETICLSLKVIGKFERIYSWLGQVEETYPQAKVTELELASENRNAALKLGLELPIMM